MKNKKILIVMPSLVILLLLIGLFIHYKVKLTELKKEVDTFEKPFIDEGYEITDTDYLSYVISKDNLILFQGSAYILNDGYGLEDYLEVISFSYYNSHSDNFEEEYQKYSSVIKSLSMRHAEGNLSPIIFTSTHFCFKSYCYDNFKDEKIIENEDSKDLIEEGMNLIEESKIEYEKLGSEFKLYNQSTDFTKYEERKWNYEKAKKDITYFLFNKYKEEYEIIWG